MPKRGAMTRARHVAPFRNAAGPSRLMMRLQKYTVKMLQSSLWIELLRQRMIDYKLKSLLCAVSNSSVCVLPLPFLQRLQTSLYNCRGIKDRLITSTRNTVSKIHNLYIKMNERAPKSKAKHLYCPLVADCSKRPCPTYPHYFRHHWVKVKNKRYASNTFFTAITCLLSHWRLFKWKVMTDCWIRTDFKDGGFQNPGLLISQWLTIYANSWLLEGDNHPQLLDISHAWYNISCHHLILCLCECVWHKAERDGEYQTLSAAPEASFSCKQ